MGERHQSDESSQYFADDEMNGIHSPVRSERRSKCERCKTALGARTRYCRACYESRDTWMPSRPTRRRAMSEAERRRSKNVRDHRRSSAPYSNPRIRVEPNGDKELPSSLFSNLPSVLQQRPPSTHTSTDFENERKFARFKRRRSAKHKLVEFKSSVDRKCEMCSNPVAKTFKMKNESENYSLCRRCITMIFAKYALCHPGGE